MIRWTSANDDIIKLKSVLFIKRFVHYCRSDQNVSGETTLRTAKASWESYAVFMIAKQWSRKSVTSDSREENSGEVWKTLTLAKGYNNKSVPVKIKSLQEPLFEISWWNFNPGGQIAVQMVGRLRTMKEKASTRACHAAWNLECVRCRG